MFLSSTPSRALLRCCRGARRGLIQSQHSYSSTTPTPTTTTTTIPSSSYAASSSKTPRILITGGLGQIGIELCEQLREIYGDHNVILSDIRKNMTGLKGEYRYVDVINKDTISKVVVEAGITWIIHLSSILSARGETDTNLALALNMRGIENVLDVARQNELLVFAPSSIAAFGPACDLENTGDVVPMRPQTIYGVSKVYLELLGEYYSKRYGVDFRSLRYPGVISYKALPGGGTTDYAVDVFYKAIDERKFTCFLEPDRLLPMMYMPDCLKATLDLLHAPRHSLTQQVYNIGAVSFTPSQLFAEIEKQLGYKLEITYEPDFRDGIAQSWPKRLDDSRARADWGWQHTYDMGAMTKDMLYQLQLKAKKE